MNYYMAIRYKLMSLMPFCCDKSVMDSELIPRNKLSRNKAVSILARLDQPM